MVGGVFLNENIVFIDNVAWGSWPEELARRGYRLECECPGADLRRRTVQNSGMILVTTSVRLRRDAWRGTIQGALADYRVA